MSRQFGPVCGIYVPGDRADRFSKAVASGADLVVLDLEDAVAPAAKAVARERVTAFLTGGTAPVDLAVRVNAVDSAFFAADLAALESWSGAGARLSEVRVPKVQHPSDVTTVAAFFPVAALIETARGVTGCEAIAAAPGVVSLGLGESDLRSELLVAGEEAFDYLRSRIVVAAAAADLRPPAMAAYPQIEDLDGLAKSCARGRSLGMYGRSAIHPSQVSVIKAAFRPGETEVRWAHDVLAALEAGDRQAQGVVRAADGSMVDAAMRRRAETIVALSAEG